MRRTGRLLSSVVFLVLSLSCLHAWAEEPTPVLSWSQVEDAISSHPGFRSSQADVAVAEGEVRVTKQYPNPDVGFSLGRIDPKAGSGPGWAWDLELTIPVEWPGAIIYRSKSAGHGVEAARHDAQAARLDVWQRLRSLYLTLAFDQERIRLLRETDGELVRLVEAVKIRVDKGEARPVELNRSHSELEEHRIALSSAEAEAMAHRHQLSLWLGGRLPDLFKVEADLDPVADVPGQKEAIQSALTKHPAIKAARARGRQAESAATAERHSAVPSLGIGGYYGEESDAANYGGIITIGIPLWNWNLGGIARADAEKLRARAQAELIEREISAAVIAAHAKAQSALQAVQRYRSGVLPASEKAFFDMEQLYRTGETGLTDVLDARRAHLRTQDAYRTELFNYHLAILELSVWMGGTPDA